MSDLTPFSSSQSAIVFRVVINARSAGGRLSFHLYEYQILNRNLELFPCCCRYCLAFLVPLRPRGLMQVHSPRLGSYSNLEQTNSLNYSFKRRVGFTIIFELNRVGVSLTLSASEITVVEIRLTRKGLPETLSAICSMALFYFSVTIINLKILIIVGVYRFL